MRDAVVVDTSIVIKWVLTEPDSATARALLAEWTKKEIVLLAPALLAYEVTNTLYQKTRKGEITLDRAKQALAKVIRSEIELNYEQNPALSTRAIELAQQFSLPATYDSHYLAVAEHEGCDLWTADMRMWNSIKGKLAWVRWLGDYSAP